MTNVNFNNDIFTIFKSIPDLYLILDSAFYIVEASDKYLAATMVKRKDIIGKHIFVVFPDNPDDMQANSVRNLRASLQRVLLNKMPDPMAVQKYDIRKPPEEGGEFVVRYWSPVNSPVLDEQGEVKYIIHRVEDVTEFIRLKTSEENEHKVSEELRLKSDLLEAEIYLRAKEIQESNRRLQIMYTELAKNEIVKSQLAAIVEATDDAIISKSIDGIIQHWNHGAEKLYGYTAEEMIGKSILILFPETLEDQFHYIKERTKQGKAISYADTKRVHKDGHLISVSVTISAIKDAKDNVIGACSIARDISEWKKNQLLIIENKELEEMAYVEKEANKLKSQFIANVSHELRTPLNSIIGFSELIQDGYLTAASDKFPLFIDNILLAGRQLLILINDILDISKIESGKIEFHHRQANIHELLAETHEIFSQMITNKKIVFNMYIDKSIKEIVIDTDKLKQVFYNYISNALKFTPINGQVTVSVTLESNNYFCILVEDSGIGIAKENFSKLFQPFNQIDDSSKKIHQGTGLGLALVKNIVEAQGGKIHVESELGKGSKFFAYLPMFPLKNVTNTESNDDTQVYT